MGLPIFKEGWLWLGGGLRGGEEIVAFLVIDVRVRRGWRWRWRVQWCLLWAIGERMAILVGGWSAIMFIYLIR